MKSLRTIALAALATLCAFAPAHAQKVLRSQTVSFDNIASIEAVPFARFDPGHAIILSDGGRSGPFIKVTGNQASLATSDPTKCLFIPDPLTPDGSNGGWLREEALNKPQYVNARWCGATGDGTTDDTAALQAAFNFGNYIFVPDGVYRTTGAIRKTGEHFTIEGAGYERTIFRPDAGTFNVFEFDDSGTAVFGVSIRDFSIIFQGERTAGSFMLFNDRLIDANIERLHMDGYYNGITVEAPGRVFFNRIIAEQTARTAGKANFTFNLIDDAVTPGKATDVHFTDVQARGGVADASAGFAHIRVNAMDGVYINNSHFLGFDYHIRFDPNGSGDQDTIASFHSTGTYYDTAFLSHAIWLGDAPLAYRGFYFSNNTFRDARGTAGSLNIQADIERLNIQGGNIRDNNRSAIITPGADTITDMTLKGVQMHNNNLEDNSAYGDLLIRVNGGNITDNDFVDGGASGIAVQLLSGSSAVRIAGNGFVKSTAGTILADSAVNTLVWANAGYLTANEGATAITTDADGQATVAHGLAGTPTLALATYFADTVNEVQVVSVDATNITVRLRNTTTNTDVVSASVTLRWYARL